MKRLTSLKTSICTTFKPVGSHIYKFFSDLGPRRTLLFLLALIWLQIGFGVLFDLGGKPTDAPHLLIPHIIRGIIWIGTAVVCIFFSVVKKRMRLDKVSILLLSFMPLLRLVSYLISWVLSWDFLTDTLFNDTAGLQGSSGAWYSCYPAIIQLVVLVAASYASVKWTTVTQYLVEEIKMEKILHKEDFGGVPEPELTGPSALKKHPRE